MAFDVDAGDYKDAARALKDADKKVAASIRKGLREIAKPLAEVVVREGSETMPSSGGLRARLESGKPLVSLAAKSASLNLKRGSNYKSINDQGIVRHKVFGNPKKWAAQSVDAGTYTDAFNHHGAETAVKMQAHLKAAVDEIAREI